MEFQNPLLVGSELMYFCFPSSVKEKIAIKTAKGKTWKGKEPFETGSEQQLQRFWPDKAKYCIKRSVDCKDGIIVWLFSY